MNQHFLVNLFIFIILRFLILHYSVVVELKFESKPSLNKTTMVRLYLEEC